MPFPLVEQVEQASRADHMIRHGPHCQDSDFNNRVYPVLIRKDSQLFSPDSEHQLRLPGFTLGNPELHLEVVASLDWKLSFLEGAHHAFGFFPLSSIPITCFYFEVVTFEDRRCAEEFGSSYTFQEPWQ